MNLRHTRQWCTRFARLQDQRLEIEDDGTEGDSATNLEYLRNCVSAYMRTPITDTATRQRLLAVIGRLLGFSQADLAAAEQEIANAESGGGEGIGSALRGRIGMLFGGDA